MASLPQVNNCGKDARITTLFVRPLAGKDQVRKLRRDDILNHFIEFGDVTSVRLFNKPKRSYGFVIFTQPESAAKALQIKIHTIAGLELEVDTAHAQHQYCVSLLDLNNDCIFGIFSAKCLTIQDLCSMAETCRRLKEIAVEVFRRRYKKCNLNELIPSRGGGTYSDFKFGWLTARDHSVAKRILSNFGSMISELEIDGYEFKDDSKRTDILDSMTRYCSDSLSSLTIKWFYIPESFAAKLQPIFNKLQKLKMTHCTFEGVSKELFTDGPAMMELVVEGYQDNASYIFEKTFPKLQHYEYKPYACGAQVIIGFESFLSRHQNLRVLNIWRSDGGSPLLQSIATNCRQLEHLQCYMPKDTTFDLSNLGLLRKLRIDFNGQSVTRSSGWNNLHFLVEIKLENANVDSEFVRSLSQLKELRVLELRWATGIQNLQQIDCMNQLTKLQIISLETVDLVRLIERLGNLVHLEVNMGSRKWWIDPKTYLQIVEVVTKRSDKSKLYIRCKNNSESKIYVYDDQYRHLVEVNC